MIVIDDRVQFCLDENVLQPIYASLTDKDVELILTDDVEIEQLNAAYRGIDKATDVLSFPLEEMPGAPLGTIVISIDKVREKALELGHAPQEELQLLFIHGLLHLLGYDHESDNGEMRQKEAAMIEAFGLPDSLIIRNE